MSDIIIHRGVFIKGNYSYKIGLKIPAKKAPFCALVFLELIILFHDGGDKKFGFLFFDLACAFTGRAYLRIKAHAGARG